MHYKFYGGVHPETHKTLTLDKPTKKALIPPKVIIPLSMHVGSPAEAIVKTGDIVEVGQLIGRAAGFISSNVHASIAGKITKISHIATPVQPRSAAITIESQGDNQEYKSRFRKDAESLSGEELVNLVRDAGVVGLGGAAFPTHVKLSPPKNKPIDSVILNGAECEPYLTCDHRIMMEKPEELFKGLEIISKILGSKDTYIAIEDNKQSAIYALEKKLEVLRAKGQGAGRKIVILKTKYPQGAEKQVIKAVLNREVPAGGLPMDVGVVVQNAQTVLAIYEAVYLNKPLIERALTITGDCVKEPVNISVRIGTLISDLINSLGGLARPPKKVVVGGPMMGIAQYSMDIPVIKGTGGIMFLSDPLIDRSKEGVCIRCGRCIDVCPIKLAPTSIMNRVKKEYFDEAKDLGIMNCYECGACAYICPAKIPLLDYMKYGKAKVL